MLASGFYFKYLKIIKIFSKEVINCSVYLSTSNFIIYLNVKKSCDKLATLKEIKNNKKIILLPVAWLYLFVNVN